MSYIRAEEVLPQELIETIQQYVSGKAIYIPSLKKKVWGSQSGIKEYFFLRNRQIFEEYREGASAKELARTYSLSEKSIRRIIRGIKEDEATREG